MSEEQVSVELTRKEAAALTKATRLSHAASAHGPGTILDGGCAACSGRDKLLAALAVPPSEERMSA